jgi:hypothetical protein
MVLSHTYIYFMGITTYHIVFFYFFTKFGLYE